MYKLGNKSSQRLKTCHPLLQKVFEEAIKTSPMDFTILQGHRGEEEQNKYYNAGKSQVKYPNGKHNQVPSLAVDAVPYPIDWNDISRFKKLGEHIKKVAFSLGVEITWGAIWSFKDYPHYELKNL